jgi:succinoglycan biosynthesis protein ExoL
MTPKIAYFVHDLSDPAVHRRVRMLTAGGAIVAPIGFRRSTDALPSVEGLPAVDLGRTADGKLAKRIFQIARVSANFGRLAETVRGANVLLARNIEMLVLAIHAKRYCAPEAAIVYECLDIHRMLLSKSFGGTLLRRLESKLWREVALLLTSSPAFVRNYFGPRHFPSPVRLVENKVLLLGEESTAFPRPAPGPPWRIGWFGIIRCRKSLEILSSLARAADGAVEIIIRGRPTAAVFEERFETLIADLPHVHFLGPYRNPVDLAQIYSEVHFSWAVDFYEAGQNSQWLLPNRIYEGSLYGAVPIALAQVETGRWLANLSAGVLLGEPIEQELLDFFRALDATTYSQFAGVIDSLPRSLLADRQSDCQALVKSLSVSGEPTASAHTQSESNPKAVILAVIPCLNEEQHIERLVTQLLKQAAELDMLIVIADGGSRDGTRAIAGRLARDNERVVFFDNKRKIQSAAVNGVVKAHGSNSEFLIRLDAHAAYPDDYCERLLAVQTRTRADSVVVSMYAEGHKCFQRAAAAAQNSVLGNGGALHRNDVNKGRWVDHGHHALMTIHTFNAIGGYDETFSHCEDVELDNRLTSNGFRIYLTEETQVTYYPRTDATALFLQYFKIGRGRALHFMKHGKNMKLRHPALLTIVPMICLLLLAPFSAIFAIPALAWGLFCLGFGLIIGIRRGDRCAAAAGAAAIIMQTGWSFGFFRGLIRGISQRLVEKIFRTKNRIDTHEIR